MRQKLLLVGILIALSGSLLLTACGENQKPVEPTSSTEKSVPPVTATTESGTTVSTSSGTEMITADYLCDEGKTISATFFNGNTNGSVTLNLSDGRTLALLRVVAASGVRYANADESVVFWNKGDTSFLEESTVETFQNCFEKK